MTIYAHGVSTSSTTRLHIDGLVNVAVALLKVEVEVLVSLLCWILMASMKN